MCCKTKPGRRHQRELQSTASPAPTTQLHSVMRTNTLRRPHAKVRSRSNTLTRTSIDLLHSRKTGANTSHSDHHLDTLQETHNHVIPSSSLAGNTPEHRIHPYPTESEAICGQNRKGEKCRQRTRPPESIKQQQS